MNQLDLFNHKEYEKAVLARIPAGECEPHPLNPRFAVNEEVVERIAVQIGEYGYKPEHAILVRPVSGHYEIVSGHHRVEACKKAGVSPYAWIAADMSDEEAHSLLLLENDQAELSALEKGKHAYDHIERYGKGEDGRGNESGLREYARRHNYNLSTIQRYFDAYQVIKTDPIRVSLPVETLYEISKAPEAAWSALCEQAEVENWTVANAKTATGKVKALDRETYGYDMASIYTEACKNKGKKAGNYQSLFNAIDEWVEALPETAVLYNFERTDEIKEEDHQVYRKHMAVEFEYRARDRFIEKVKKDHPLVAKTIEEYGQETAEHIKANQDGGERWLPELTAEEVENRTRLALQVQHKSFLDRHIRCGDMNDIMLEVPKHSVDLILADPPYGLGETADIQFDHREDMSVPKGEWDHETNYKQWLQHFRRVLKETASLYIFVPDSEIGNLWAELEAQGFIVRNLITWHKTNPAPSVRQRCFCHSCEYILFASVSDEYTFNWQGQNETHNFIEMPICQGDERLEHPTQKPVALMEWLVNISSNVGDFVVDPFAGVGSTGVAAHNLNREFLLMEVDNEFCRQACLRFPREDAGKQAL